MTNPSPEAGTADREVTAEDVHALLHQIHAELNRQLSELRRCTHRLGGSDARE